MPKPSSMVDPTDNGIRFRGPLPARAMRRSRAVNPQRRSRRPQRNADRAGSQARSLRSRNAHRYASRHQDARPARAEATPEPVVKPRPPQRPLPSPSLPPSLRRRRARAAPGGRARTRPAPAQDAYAAGRRAVEARPHTARRRRAERRERSRRRQQDSRDRHQQAVRPRDRAQARPRRHRRALSEGPQLPAAVGVARRAERARPGRDRLSAHDRRRRPRSEGLSDAEAQCRQRGRPGPGRAEVHRDALDLRAACDDRPRALHPRQPEHRLQARLRRRRRAEEDRGIQRPRQTLRQFNPPQPAYQALKAKLAEMRNAPDEAERTASATARCCATPATAAARKP